MVSSNPRFKLEEQRDPFFLTLQKVRVLRMRSLRRQLKIMSLHERIRWAKISCLVWFVIGCGCGVLAMGFSSGWM